MKKLMIAAAIVCAAAFANAATYNWAADKSYIYSINGTAPDYPAVAAGTTVYFAFVDNYSQADLVSDYAKGSIDTSKFTKGAETVMNAAGGITQTANFTTDYEADKQVYFAIIEDGSLFISQEAKAEYNKLSTSPIVFADQTSISDFESNLPKNAGDGYTSAGWYQSVPEPTSGLLLLIGMAGLALRRRRA